ncbi:Hypothetical protein PENO1_077160 [Penicillium occitanis (nom. inval.)]|nr:hypothetical protein PENOC_090660 [Penicillium occitanis (nom. inval.)]PCG94671.1 Hypothetical protein PENO1_077160 [Penicillium occitanis (nom. inval.)]
MVIPQFQRQQTEYIGTEETSTVYAVEAYGVKFGLKTLLRFAEDDPRFQRVVIFSDSQSALQSIQNPRMASGQTYIRDCINLCWECVDNIDIILLWIPGHEGIPGNEVADRAAIMGARRQIVPGDIKNWIMFGAAAKRRIRAEAKKAWVKTWDRSKSGKPTKKLVLRPSKGNL